MNHKILISASFLFTFLLSANYLIAQPTQEWISFYEYSSNSSLTMCIDSSGNVFTSGNDGIPPYGFVTIKYNSSGQKIWERRFVGGMNFIARPVSIGCDQQGNIYIAAYDESMILIKYNSLGVQQWFRRYPANYLSDMVITKHGFPIITGTVINGAPTRNDCVTVKYNHIGDTLWSAIYNSPSNNWDWSVAMDISMIGEVCITGYSGNSGNTEVDFLTVKYDSNGVQQWVRNYGNPNSWDEAKDVSFDQFGNVYVAGLLNINLPRFSTIKYSSGGIQEWVEEFHHPENREEYPSKIKIDPFGNPIITGGAFSIDSLPRIKFLTVKYNSSGIIQWSNLISWWAPSGPPPRNLFIDNLGNSFVIGTRENFTISNSTFELLVRKYDPEGVFQWDIIYNGPNYSASGHNIIINKFFDIYLNGHQADSAGANFITIKYSQPIGIEPISNEIPINFTMFQNYPNPFNPNTTIKFDIPKSANVTIKIYDILGKVVSVLAKSEFKNAGSYKVTWDASSFSSGIYFYRIEVRQTGSSTGNFTATKKMVLLK